MEYINLKKDNILRIGLRTAEGQETGECWEFDLEDIELPLRLQKLIDEHKKNAKYFETQLLIIDKKQDHKGKKLLSSKQEETVKAWREYYRKEIEVFDMFLGKDGCKKYLNGRNPYYTMFKDIEEAINSIMPLIKQRSVDIKDLIKSKYGGKSEDVLEEAE